MLGVGQALAQLLCSPPVALEVLDVLVLDGIDFALRRPLAEERADEELRENVKRLCKMVWRDVKMVIGVFGGGVGVRGSAALREEVQLSVPIQGHMQHMRLKRQ